MQKRILLAAVMVTALLLATAGFAPTAFGMPAAAQRINFPPGSSSFTLSVNLAQGVAQSYLLGITAGQTLSITKSGSATVQVFGPQGYSLAGPNDQAGPWSVAIPQTGDYSVRLVGQGQVGVTFAIPPATQPGPVPGQPARIRFGWGQTSSTLDATLTQDVPASYVLGLRAGQKLYVTLAGNATAWLRNPFGGQVQPVSAVAGQWQFPAAWTGDYQLVVQGTGPVTLTVYVPSVGTPATGAIRIRFARGASSASFNANLVLGVPRSYVLGIMAGQQLFVSTTGNATFTVVDRAGNILPATVLSSGQWRYNIPRTGDFTVVAAGQGLNTITIAIPAL